MLVRQAGVGVLILALAFAGMNTLPAALPQAHAQSYGVAGTILGLAIIAGVVYLVSRDRDGVYHRYYYGRYNGPHYRYEGAYYNAYPRYHDRYYRGPLPGRWRSNEGCVGGPPWVAECR
ncbi:MAG TPA: hypothetical protein VKZ50_13440 [bacterium]|nr:hypothetical protein [bacterium]